MRSSILIIDCGSSKVVDIEKQLDAINITFKTKKWNSLTARESNNFGGIIISGAPILITEINPKPYLKALDFLKTYKNPVLGICFGHQLLGILHGAKVSLCKEDRNWQEIIIEQSSTLFNYIRKPYRMVEDHTEEVTLPEGFKLLATSKVCKNEAMQHKIKPLFGVQFHPEVSERGGLQLLKNFCKTCF